MGLEVSVLDKVLPDLDIPSAVGLKVSVLDKLLPDFADKPSTVGLEVEETGLSVGKDVVGLAVIGLAVFGLDVVGLAVIGLDVVGLVVIGLDVVGKDVTGLDVGPTVGFMDER